ncbi:MAG: hypothetical protein ACTSU5_14950 [Promethearchaeota archaeon]
MDAFRELRNFVETLKLGTRNYSVWETGANSKADTSGLPMRVGRGAWRGVLFEEEIALELGGVSTPSTAIVLCTNGVDLVHQGRVTLVGPDLPDIHGPNWPFALVILVGGKKITADEINKVRRVVHISDEIEGFAQRSVSRRFWYRVGRKIRDRGVSFRDIGRAFAYLFQSSYPEMVERVEVTFVTTSPGDVERLVEIEKVVKEQYTTAFKDKIARIAKLRDDCGFDWDCDVCDYEPVCEEIRDIIKIREDTMAGGGDE